MTPKKHIGIKELARRMGVAKSTVSKAMSGHPDINAATRRKIMAAAKLHKYQPSGIAQALTLKRTQMIGLVMHRPGSGYFIELAESIVREARQRGYRVTFDFSDDNPEMETEILADYRRRKFDGLIIAPSMGDSAAMLAENCGDLPYVIIDYCLKGSKAPFVGNDFKEIGCLAAKHLLELGHRHIAWLDAPKKITSARARLAGFSKACRKFKTSARKELIWQGPFEESAGEKAALGLIRNFPEITAFFCASGPLAMGVLRAARRCGKNAPKDISVIGASALGNISAVSQRAREIGQVALETLLRRMKSLPVKRRQIIGVELDIRGTTAPPPAHDFKREA